MHQEKVRARNLHDSRHTGPHFVLSAAARVHHLVSTKHCKAAAGPSFHSPEQVCAAAGRIGRIVLIVVVDFSRETYLVCFRQWSLSACSGALVAFGAEIGDRHLLHQCNHIKLSTGVRGTLERVCGERVAFVADLRKHAVVKSPRDILAEKKHVRLRVMHTCATSVSASSPVCVRASSAGRFAAGLWTGVLGAEAAAEYRRRSAASLAAPLRVPGTFAGTPRIPLPTSARAHASAAGTRSGRTLSVTTPAPRPLEARRAAPFPSHRPSREFPQALPPFPPRYPPRWPVHRPSPAVRLPCRDPTGHPGNRFARQTAGPIARAPRRGEGGKGGGRW